MNFIISTGATYDDQECDRNGSSPFSDKRHVKEEIDAEFTSSQL
jgi:hypothetical protein